jgi:hypothetical protein
MIKHFVTAWRRADETPAEVLNMIEYNEYARKEDWVNAMKMMKIVAKPRRHEGEASTPTLSNCTQLEEIGTSRGKAY